LDCAEPDHARLRDALLQHAGGDDGALSDGIGPETLEKLLALPHVAVSPPARHPGDVDLARLTIAEELAKIEALRGLAAELDEATEDMAGRADEALTWRLREAAEARNRALLSRQEDKVEYDLGENGARIKRDEREAFDALLERITYSKPGR
ncbi:MAG: DNA primase, partial [Roseovarius sp.]|nr:DNA primase [Roseovarius sp.]